MTGLSDTVHRMSLNAHAKRLDWCAAHEYGSHTDRNGPCSHVWPSSKEGKPWVQSFHSKPLSARPTSRDRMPSQNTLGCRSSGCQSDPRGQTLTTEVEDRIHDHPCYSEEAHQYYARMHVAVAPACNIQCNYCNRKFDCANESRPGVVSERLTPEQAARKVMAVASRVPQLSVLGIAGPGDACCNFDDVRRTFELVRRNIPDLKLCVSTNWLKLMDSLMLSSISTSHM